MEKRQEKRIDLEKLMFTVLWKWPLDGIHGAERLKVNKYLMFTPEAGDNFPNDGEEGLGRDGRLVTAVQADQHLAQLLGHQTVTLVVPQVAECRPPSAVFGLQGRQLLDVTAKFLNVAVGKNT
jgi:hypothetical protein